MVSLRGKTKRQVVVYSMGRDGSAPVHDALSVCPQINTHQVYTLDPAKIANMNLRGGTLPDHIKRSDHILREGLAGDVPHYFVTMVHDPFGRHVRQSFYLLQHHAGEGGIGYALANPKTVTDHFASVPSTQTTHWFQDEYLPATGIDVFNAPFNHAQGYQKFKLGIHHLLLLSAHLPPDQQASILSDFLDAGIPEILPENNPMDGLRDIFMAQILSAMHDQVISDFWYTRMAQHFFSTRQIGTFQEQNDDIARQILSMQNNIDALQGTTTRDRLLQNALSPEVHTPQLTAELAILAKKRGTDTMTALTGSMLRQMQRAQNNLLLSALRAIGEDDPKSAVELGEHWLDKQDTRLVKTLATMHQRASAINRPLELFQDVPDRDAAQESQYQRLCAQKRMMDAPFPFSSPRAPLYSPAPQTVLYHAHQSLPFHTSGYATRTQGLIRALRDTGYDVRPVTRAGYPADTGIDPAGIDEFSQDGVPYQFDTHMGRGQWDLPIDRYIDQAASHLVEQAQSFRPAILHSASNYLCGLSGIEAARRLGIPSIYEMRGLWHITHWSRDPDYAATDKFALAQKLELESAHQADHVLAITGALKEWLVDQGIPESKISVAPNAVDMSQFQMRTPDRDFARECGCAGKTVIGYIGSFVQYEGLDLLIQAIALLPVHLLARIKLLWLGDGPVLPDLLAQAAENGVAENIISLGRRPFDEVPHAYSIVDIAVFPRRAQMICEIVSPLKPFEAMAMGKAVIASDVRPLAEIINHGRTGLLHAKDNAGDLSAQLARLIEDKHLRQSLGRHARDWVSRTRRWDMIAKDVITVYEGLA